MAIANRSRSDGCKAPHRRVATHLAARASHHEGAKKQIGQSFFSTFFFYVAWSAPLPVRRLNLYHHA